jgi:hypothetical protein
MRDLFTLLIAKFVEENFGPERGPKESDEGLQWMESLLNPGAEMREEVSIGQERHALVSYLELDGSELQSLPPVVHDWFLERWAMSGPWSEDRRELSLQASLIARTYFAAGPGIYQFTCVRALLAFDERTHESPSYLSGIWDPIFSNDELQDDFRSALLLPLTDTLVDLTQLDKQGSRAQRALRELVNRDRKTGYIKERLIERAEAFGDPYRKDLLELLNPGSERSF